MPEENRMKTFAQLTIAVAMVTLAAPSAGAESYAKRPIRVLVASAPSGPSDVQIRLLVPKMTEVLGQSLIVDNRASNNGVVASEIAAKATPDGYTIQVGNSGTHAITPACTSTSRTIR
jgi:tripartite-type tricarboxylate transporter receptor subunit TctC